MLKLSIITINYNNLEGLKRTVESVVNQTWQEFEYIIIDGGSSDGSAAYIESQSKSIDYWVSEPDKGIYNAMNKGIAKATGEYLLFLNSGDHFYDTTVLQENIKYLQNYDLICFDIEVRGDTTSEIVTYPEKIQFSDLCFGSLCHQSTFIKKELFEIIGFYDEKLKLVSDWKFFILVLFKYNCSYFKVSTILSTYYLDGVSSYTSNQKLLRKEREQVLNSDFKGYIEDINQLLALKKIVSSLRKSRKISWLVKLGLIHKF